MAMRTVTYYVPAFSLREAAEIAEAVHAGRLLHREHYLDEASAERVCGHLNRLSPAARRVYAILIAVEDSPEMASVGLGDIAAALTLVCFLPALAASLWGLLS